LKREINKAKWNTAVLKLGGRVLEDEEFILKVADAVIKRKYLKKNTIIVHGGGDAVTSLAERLGIKCKFVNGIRITDEKVIKLLLMQLAGVENKKLVLKLCSMGVDAVGIGGVDSCCMQAKNIISVKDVHVGLVGEPVKFDPCLLNALLEEDFTPVFYGLGINKRYEILNINADQSAAAVAVEIGANQLLFCSDIDGVMDTNGNIINLVGNSDFIQGLNDGYIGDSMKVKIEAGLNFYHKTGNYAWIVGKKGAIQILKCDTEEATGTKVGEFK